MKAKVFCENIFNDILPAVRAIVADNLMNKHGFNQLEASEKLGLTQPAVSQYRNGLRGKDISRILSNKGMAEYVDFLSEEVASGESDLNLKVCEICSRSRQGGIFTKEELNPFICLLELAGVKKQNG